MGTGSSFVRSRGKIDQDDWTEPKLVIYLKYSSCYKTNSLSIKGHIGNCLSVMKFCKANVLYSRDLMNNLLKSKVPLCPYRGSS